MSGHDQQVLSNLDGEHFPNGLHICHIFNDDAERLQTLARFHSSGLRAGEFGLMLSDVILRKDFLAALAALGMPIPEDSQKLVSGSAEGAYCPGEMGWAARRGSTTEKLLEYEALVKEAMVQWPSTAACEYDARLFSGATILDVLNVHPAMIVRGQIVVNPYYMDPRTYLAQYRQRRSVSS